MNTPADLRFGSVKKVTEPKQENPMLLHLKIKIKSLASEARIIRHHESKALTNARVARVRRRLQEAGLENAAVERIAKRAAKVLGRRFVDFDAHVDKCSVEYLDTPALQKASRQGPHDLMETFMNQYDSLRGHRVGVVRSEARHSLLAYACLRGRPYISVEASGRVEPDWDRVATMAVRFGQGEPGFSATACEEWVKQAKALWQEARDAQAA